jgi:hypothetical protein
MAQYKNLQIILTARDYVFAPWLTWLPRVSISGLQDPEVRELVTKWFAGTESSVDEFFETLRSSPALMEVMHVPLLATLIILVYRKKKTLPKSRGRLYGIFVELLCGGWDLAKGVIRLSQFGVDVKIMVLSALASRTHSQGKRLFRISDLVRVVKQAIPRLLKQSNVLLEELLADGLLVQEGAHLQFRHQSFQEYFAARELTHAIKTAPLEQALKHFVCGDDWWKEVIRFYVELCEQPMEFVSWLRNESGLYREYSVTIGMHELFDMIVDAYPHSKINVPWGYDPDFGDA